MCPSKSYEAAAEWAERDATLPARSATALRGDDAAEFGRSVVARALGRPSIDPGAKPGEQAPRRQVRLPRAVSLAILLLLLVAPLCVFVARKLKAQ